MKWFAFISLFLLILTTSSCKKCEVTNSVGGDIILGAIVKVVDTPKKPMLIRNADEFHGDLQVRFDGSLSYQNINFSKYSALCLPTTSTCSAGFDRVATINNTAESVKYNITVTECATCERKSRIYNWVLIPAVPMTFTATFGVDYIQ